MSILEDQARYEAQQAKNIADHYKKQYQRIIDATKKNRLSTKDEEFWQITGEYVDQHQEVIDRRINILKQEERKQKASERPERECQKCGGIIPSEQAVGRRKYCDDCRSVSSSKVVKTKNKAQNCCLDCGEVIPPTGKRGRPASRCNNCKKNR